MIGDIKKYKLFYAGAVVVLFLSFSINFFGAVRTDEFLHNYKDSEALVVNEINCRGKYFGGQMLEVKDHNSNELVQKVCTPSGLVAYYSQYGLQGKIYTLGYRAVALFHIHLSPYIALAQLSTALISALCFGLLALWSRRHFGLFVGIVVTFLVAVSPMIVGFARNLYWMLPLMIAPFIYVLYGYDTKRDKTKIFFWTVLGVLFYLKFLCGYEYVTAITIMAGAGIGYHLYLGRKTAKVYIKEGVTVLLVALIAFSMAFGTHVYSLQHYTGSTREAVIIIKKRALLRTLNSSEFLTYPYSNFEFLVNDAYLTTDSYLHLQARSNSHSQFWASVTSVLNYALLPVTMIPISLNQPFATYIQSLVFFVGVLIYLYMSRRKWVGKGSLRQVEALFLGAAIGFVGYLSWMIMAHSHSLVHAHINGILMYLPFALFGYMIIGLYLQTFMSGLLKKYKNGRK